ncbi:hypothetical protein T440DRAFT_226237 [Plenodomus tracheiphilus IPT5]|uniref:Uncharacterized protein n=1 Tax=Plenodomus tracheiphilus IPT5 TaxID=1408161 RepID=A0A6A7AUM6_9PLEO|nr:hypothetical protein T440DRAFT_226237 [Plenodomus tracheiphilus IPT5]
MWRPAPCRSHNVQRRACVLCNSRMSGRCDWPRGHDFPRGRRRSGADSGPAAGDAGRSAWSPWGLSLGGWKLGRGRDNCLADDACTFLEPVSSPPRRSHKGLDGRQRPGQSAACSPFAALRHGACLAVRRPIQGFGRQREHSAHCIQSRPRTPIAQGKRDGRDPSLGGGRPLDLLCSRRLRLSAATAQVPPTGASLGIIVQFRPVAPSTIPPHNLLPSSSARSKSFTRRRLVSPRTPISRCRRPALQQR